jgi:hypothetical protein
VTLPSEFHSEDYHIHRDTLRVYKAILGRNKPLKIKEIDEDGIPWVEFREKRRGKNLIHSLAFNHDGFKLIEE